MEEHRKHINCRVCLRYDLKNTDKCFLLFEKYNNSLISEKIKYVTNLEITQNDGLPDKICPDCILQLESAIAFKQKCETSDRILKNIMQMPSKMCKVTFIPLLPVKKEVEVVVEELPISTYDEPDEDIPTHSDIEQNQPNEDIPTHSDIEENPPDLPGPDDKIKPIVRKSKAIDLKLICDDCGESFKSKCKIAVHWKKVHLPGKLICPICKRIFKSFKAFNVHVKKKSRSCLVCSKIRVEGQGKQRVFHCLTCTYYTKRAKDMDTHLTIHTGDRRFECSDCHKTFTQQSSLQGHRESCHKDIRVERTCHYCGKVIKGRCKYYKHLLVHRPKTLQCEVCKIMLKTRGSLMMHMKRHSGVKNCVCEVCSAKFYTIGELYNHRKKVHFKEKVFKCDLCEYSMYTIQTLKVHRAKHTSTNVVCLVCGVFVEDAEKLALHQKRHIEKNFSCVHCDGVFYRRDSLRRHIVKKHKDKVVSKQEPVKVVLKKIKQECPSFKHDERIESPSVV